MNNVEKIIIEYNQTTHQFQVSYDGIKELSGMSEIYRTIQLLLKSVDVLTLQTLNIINNQNSGDMNISDVSNLN